MSVVTVVILFDRHCDPQVTVHATSESADACVANYKQGYPEVNRWTTMDHDDRGMLRRFISSYDDGPKIDVIVQRVQQ
jgi:hypothetical protein